MTRTKIYRNREGERNFVYQPRPFCRLNSQNLSIVRQTTRIIVIPSPTMLPRNHLIIRRPCSRKSVSTTSCPTSLGVIIFSSFSKTPRSQGTNCRETEEEKVGRQSRHVLDVSAAATENWAIRIHIRVGLRARRCSRSAFNIRILFEACMQPNRSFPVLFPLGLF